MAVAARCIFPSSCLHCEDAPCVTVCPTGASYKRAEDGIVLVNAEACIGCKLCAWACPYGARELRRGRRRDEEVHALRRPDLQREPEPRKTVSPPAYRTCPAGARHFGDLADPDSDVSRLVAARQGYELMPEQGCRPVNRYLPPRPKQAPEGDAPDLAAPAEANGGDATAGLLARWVDRVLSR
jgi:sulfite dehydrogenase (quinone) subunit SoeB